MKQPIMQLIYGMSLLTFVGCAGQGEVIPIQVHPVLSGTEKLATPTQGLRVTVNAFEDARTYKTHLGTRTHLWGGVSYFDIPGANPGEVVTQVIADYLRSKGWQAEVASPAATRTDSDVILGGALLDLAVNAKGRFGSTKLTTTTKLAIQAKNTADGSLIRMTLTGTGSDSVFWFEPEDAQGLLNDVLTDSFTKLVQDTKVENRLLRLK